MFDCNNCKDLNIKEQDQSKNKEAHICLRYKKQVKHNMQHPRLVPCKDCNQFFAMLRNLVN
jgi:hypothetical protein